MPSSSTTERNRRALEQSREHFRAQIAELRRLAGQAATDEEARMLISRIAQISRRYRIMHGVDMAESPLAQAVELDPGYRTPEHLLHLSDRIADAVRDVEHGQNRMLAVSMPPRAGKSQLVSRNSPIWMLRRHPDWKIMLASYDSSLTTAWTRGIRETVEERPGLGIALKADGGAGGVWETVEGGGMFATSVGGNLTGRGARVLIIDDPIKDFVEAHSPNKREALWNWWLSVAQTRLEPPYLVLVVMTRWHEDDFVGRLVSREHEGNPLDWERIVLPAIAGPGDPIGREEGDPLFSPIVKETREQAIERWADVRRSVGTYTFSAMYQQSPAPAKGAIFDSTWWRYWTTDPSRVTDDGRVVYLDPDRDLDRARWVDSWDMAFKGTDASDYVVAQRWARSGGNRYLLAQQRGRWSFTETVERMKLWTGPESSANPWGDRVHERLVEDKANGTAVMDTLKDRVSGIKAVSPKDGKEARARAVTPEVESGSVYLPHPSDPGNEWVTDLLSELRNFPHDAHDDQVDTLTQALMNLREGRGMMTVPGRGAQVPRNIGQTALAQYRRPRGLGGR